MVWSFLDRPTHPADALAAAQIRRTIVLDAAFLHQVPERRPTLCRFRMPMASLAILARLDRIARWVIYIEVISSVGMVTLRITRK